MEKRRAEYDDEFREPEEDDVQPDPLEFFNTKKAKGEAEPVGKKTLDEELKQLEIEKERERKELDRKHDSDLERIRRNFISLKKKMESDFKKKEDKLQERYRTRPNLEKKEKEIEFWDVPGNQNMLEGGKQACVCISLVAIQCFLRRSGTPGDYEPDDWKKIMKAGAVIHEEWIKSPIPKSSSYPNSVEVFEFAKGDMQGLVLAKNICGNLVDSISRNVSYYFESEQRSVGDCTYTQTYASTLEDAINEMARHPQSALLLSVNEYSVSICQKNENGKSGMWLFDSHVNKNSPTGVTSSLFLFRNKMKMIDHIKKVCIVRHCESPTINIFNATIFCRGK